MRVALLPVHAPPVRRPGAADVGGMSLYARRLARWIPACPYRCFHVVIGMAAFAFRFSRLGPTTEYRQNPTGCGKTHPAGDSRLLDGDIRRDAAPAHARIEAGRGGVTRGPARIRDVPGEHSR